MLPGSGRATMPPFSRVRARGSVPATTSSPKSAALRPRITISLLNTCGRVGLYRIQSTRVSTETAAAQGSSRRTPLAAAIATKASGQIRNWAESSVPNTSTAAIAAVSATPSARSGRRQACHQINASTAISATEISTVLRCAGAPMRQAPCSTRSRSPLNTRSSEPGTLSYCHPRAPRYEITCPIAPAPPQTLQATRPAKPDTAANTERAHLALHDKRRDQHDRPQLREPAEHEPDRTGERMLPAHERKCTDGERNADEVIRRVHDEQHRRRQNQIRPRGPPAPDAEQQEHDQGLTERLHREEPQPESVEVTGAERPEEPDASGGYSTWWSRYGVPGASTIRAVPRRV